jgi:DNA-binding NarL/FixJ family response regulator
MSGWQLCGSSDSVRASPALIATLAPDVVASDLRLLDGHVSRLARELRLWPKPPRLLLLTAAADDLLLFETLSAGASGYCVEACNPAQFAHCLQGVAAGRATMSPLIARHTLNAFGLPRSSLAQAGMPAAALDTAASQGAFKQSEQHLLSLLAQGLLLTEIALRWCLGLADVERRVGEIYAKLHSLSSAAGPLPPLRVA